jgi:hypothetical protein
VPVFPSREWIEAYCDELSRHPDAPDVAAGLAGVYRFVVEPGGPLRERQVHGVEVRPAEGGGPPLVHPLSYVEPADADLSISAAYPQWRQLVDGKLDLALALMLRRVKVGGNLQRLTGRLSSAQPLMEALRSVDTVWLGEVER